MTAAWDSLYLPSDDITTLSAAIKNTLVALDYTFYDPFNALAPGIIYAQTVKLFIAPPDDGWTRILVAPDAAFDAEGLARLAMHTPILALALTGSESHITTYRDGSESDLIKTLTPCLHTDYTPDDLRRALLQSMTRAEETVDESLPPLDVLPDDVREMAGSLNPKQVNKLFGKMMKQVNRMVGGEQAAAARALIAAGPQWESAGGRRIRGVMACLTVPQGWHTPDFVALRDAYQLHLRRRNRPDAPLYPGDEAAMLLVPDALDYTPIYAGKVDK